MAKVTFEQRLYHRYLKDYSQALKDFFCKMVLEILSDNIDHMKDFIVAAMRQKSEKVPESPAKRSDCFLEAKLGPKLCEKDSAADDTQ